VTLRQSSPSVAVSVRRPGSASAANLVRGALHFGHRQVRSFRLGQEGFHSRHLARCVPDGQHTTCRRSSPEHPLLDCRAKIGRKARTSRSPGRHVEQLFRFERAEGMKLVTLSSRLARLRSAAKRLRQTNSSGAARSNLCRQDVRLRIGSPPFVAVREQRDQAIANIFMPRDPGDYGIENSVRRDSLPPQAPQRNEASPAPRRAGRRNCRTRSRRGAIVVEIVLARKTHRAGTRSAA